MMRRLVTGALGVLLLTSCEFPGGTKSTDGHSVGLKASVDLSMASLKTVSALKSVSAFRTQEVVDFTPLSYRVTIARISLMREDGAHVELYKGTSPVELADQQAVAAVLNAEALPVEPGTYVGAQISFAEVHSIKGEAKLGGTTVYTKAQEGGDAKTGPAEHADISSRGDRELHFAKPLTIKEGENVEVSLVYDLTDSVNFYSQIHDDGFRYRDGEGIELKYIPFFAFVGEPPKPEIYKVTIADTEQTRITTDTEWHYQMVLFAKDNKELAGLQCIGRIDEGFSGNHFSAINFVNNRLDKHSLNADGSYRLVGYNEGGGAFPMYEVKAFKRESHSGKVLFYTPWGQPPMTAPVELTYQATKLE